MRGAAEGASMARARLRAAFEEEVRGGGPSLWRGVRAGLVREGLLRPERAPLLRFPRRRAAALAAAAAGLALIAAPALLWRGGDEDRAEIVHNASVPAGAAVAESTVAEPAPSGLVPIHDLRERLSTQQLPTDPRYELTSSPVR